VHAGTPVPAGTEASEQPVLGTLIAEDAQTKRSRRLLVLQLAVGLGAILGLLVIFYVFLPDIMEVMRKYGGMLQENKRSPLNVSVCLIVCMSFSVVLMPGRIAWSIVVGFIYSWPGYCFLLVAHGFGGLLAFLLARLIRQSLEGDGERAPACARGCCPKCRGKQSELELMLIAGISTIEDWPFRMVFLLGLSPLPVPLVAYTLGAKAGALPWWKFFLAFTLSGGKLLTPIYLGMKADNIAELAAGKPQDPVDAATTVVSILAAIGTSCLIARLAVWKFKKIQAERQAEPQPGGQERQPGAEGPAAEGPEPAAAETAV